VTQQELGVESNQRLAVIAVDLATEGVEVVGGGGAVDDLHVAVLMLSGQLLERGELVGVVIAHLEVTLDTGARVLGTLTIVTVGQQHGKTSALEPLLFTRGDELINDALSVVGKVTELSLPENEGVGVDKGVSELEAKSTKLGE